MSANTLKTQAGLALFLGTLSLNALAEPDVRPGLWETTVTSSIPGMPMAPPPITHQSCITADDLVPHDDEMPKECQRADHKVEGNTVSWKVECVQDGMSTVGNGSITYVGDTFTGEIEMVMQGGPDGSMTMTQKMQGRRIGDCKK